MVSAGIRALTHARKGGRPAEGVKPCAPAAHYQTHRAEDNHRKNVCEARLSVACRRNVDAEHRSPHRYPSTALRPSPLHHSIQLTT
ncbi:jg3001 [Pararge aegeria aegeria]|uniref:Jg3001 protein n=1 Tax=Pararge aegeria aegeria TaxID=348720 RepID=A0A8S4R4J7_9NEOP|nr:jg3001 [Pararge aegeria aegeria]